MPVRRRPGDLLGVAGGAGDGAAGGAVGEPLDDEPPQRRRQLGQPLELDRAAGRPVAAAELGVDQRVEHLGLVAQQLRRAEDVARGGRVDLGQRRQQPVADAVARVGASALVGSSRQARPRSSQ